jgi:hypothetical protein
MDGQGKSIIIATVAKHHRKVAKNSDLLSRDTVDHRAQLCHENVPDPKYTKTVQDGQAQNVWICWNMNYLMEYKSSS